MRRIMIVGPCGSGKSTLAARLGELLSIPSYHLDSMAWRSGWVEREPNEWLPELEEVVARDAWIIDGNDSGTMPLRPARADTVVSLDFHPARCVWRVLKRIAANRGRTRADMAAGCPERFDLFFLLYVATWNGRPRRKNEAVLKQAADRMVRLRSPRELDAWLETLERPPARGLP